MIPEEFPRPLVGTEWLAEHLHDPDIRIVDARWRSRFENGRGISDDDREGYLAGHIPGAVFLAMRRDLGDPAHPVPDMLAPPKQFASVMDSLGIGDSTFVVAYDNLGFPLGSARLWWALSYYGHDRVAVLDGGLREWRLEGRAMTTDVPTVQSLGFTPRPRPEWIAAKSDVVAALGRKDTVIIDCLSADQYHARGKHSWGERAGHIPGAVNVPYAANVDPALRGLTISDRARLLESGRSLRFAAKDVLQNLYAEAGTRSDSKVITYCGRGYAASCGLLALKALGHANVRLYHGSWTEWSGDPSLPVQVG